MVRKHTTLNINTAGQQGKFIMSDHEKVDANESSSQEDKKEETLVTERGDKVLRTSELYRTKNLPERFDRPGVY